MDNIQINPVGSMSLLSQSEANLIKLSADSHLYQLFRSCSLAVLNSSSYTDDVESLLQKHTDFDIRVLQRERGVKLELINPPDTAFVDGEIIRGVNELLFAVLRDILFIAVKHEARLAAPDSSADITNLIFDILRNAQVVKANSAVNMVVCWGGHSISEAEYDFSKEVGYQLGLRGFNICTGCGPGAMKGPMKGATIGHVKQRFGTAQFVGLTEPGIIAAEPPNPIVNQLIIMPDIEKRLEAFVRIAHSIIIFPGGVGTAEELLYLLGIMLHPENKAHRLPIILAGRKESAEYFQVLDNFVATTLGPEAQSLYEIIIDDPEKVAQRVKEGTSEVREFRKNIGDAYHFNWTLHIDPDFQQPFMPTHDAMAGLKLFPNQKKNQLAAHLRRAFSGIVAGNVKPEGLLAVAEKGPYVLHGDRQIMEQLDKLLQQFVQQGRMKLPGSDYHPCYRIALE